jgi:hypothetical protein
MERFLRNTSKFLALALIPVVMFLFHNQLSNWHYHILSNGMMVKHAHPYNKSEKPTTPFSNHQHSDFDFFILGQLSALSLILTFLLFSLLIYAYLNKNLIFGRYRFPHLQQQFLSLQFLRAPPL